MNTATRSILTGALAAGLLFASPLAAGAATPASVPSIAQYEGAPVPSAVADLTMSAAVQDGVLLNAEPSSALDYMFKASVHPVGSPGAVRVSAPFTASGESWVAVEVPVGAHGTDVGKSTLADAGVAYVRAVFVTYAPAATAAPSTAPNAVNPVQPTSQPTAAGPSPTATPAPSASATPAAAAEPTVTERASVPEPGAQPNWLAAGGSLLMGGLVMFPLYKLKRRA